MERFLFVAAGSGFWALIAWQAIHLTGLWIGLSSVVLLFALIGLSFHLVPQDRTLTRS